MICRIVRLFLPLYIENDLPDLIASRLSRHLGHCDSCVADHQSFMGSQSAREKDCVARDSTDATRAVFDANRIWPSSRQDRSRANRYQNQPSI